MKVKVKHKREVEDTLQAYKDRLETIFEYHAMGLVSWIVFGMFLIFIVGTSVAKLLFIAVLFLILFSFIWNISVIARKKRDLEIGVVLLKQCHLYKIKIKGKFVEFFFCEDECSRAEITRTLFCFNVKYSEGLEKDEIVVNCRKNTVRVSSSYLIKNLITK